MFSGNDFTPLEVMDSKLSSTMNSLTWSLNNIKNTGLSRVQQKALRRALMIAQEGLNKGLLIIDNQISLKDK